MRRPLRWGLVGLLAVVAFGAGVVSYAYVEQGRPHFTPGVARIDGYAVGSNPSELILLIATGYGDQVDAAVATEEAGRVLVTVRTFVYVPPRGGFKNLAAYLGRTAVTLREPLAERTVVDAPTGQVLPRRSVQP